jgi:cytoskeletal protein CcmA (bactofilin family)
MWKKPEPDEPQSLRPLSYPISSTVPSNPSPGPTAPAEVHGEGALIGQSLYVKGDLRGAEDLRIEGTVEGKIELPQNNVIVGKNGRVKADIYGRVISIEGEVQGNLEAEEQLILRQSSTTRGNIRAARVILEDGANFKGSIDMTPREEVVPETAATVPESNLQDSEG